MNNKNNFLTQVPPMGIYQTLYDFQNSFGTYMGEKGTHPWSQGFPLTTQIPGGPKMPQGIKVNANDLYYPKAWGQPQLRKKIAEYYNYYYKSNIDFENVMIFSGGRPGLIALLMFLQPDIEVRIASTEYTPYYDMLRLFKRDYKLIDSKPENLFTPTIDEYIGSSNTRKLIMLSNPCNPTGITRSGKELQYLVESTTNGLNGLLIDEAYELFHKNPVSALRYIKDINNSNLFVAGAATKGLQAPGIRIGWVIASKKNVEVLGNFSSFAMGGVSRLSQLYASELLNKSRTDLIHKAIPDFYEKQRIRYKEKFLELNLEIFSGDGGFYHWCKLPNKITAKAFNEKLFQYGAAILKGNDCNMARDKEKESLDQFFRFSFGPLMPQSFKSDINLMEKVLNKF